VARNSASNVDSAFIGAVRERSLLLVTLDFGF
jgi:hypothetical protein